MNKILLPKILLFLTYVMFGLGHANVASAAMLDDTCAVVQQIKKAEVDWPTWGDRGDVIAFTYAGYKPPFGMTCEGLQKWTELGEIVQTTLMPATLAIQLGAPEFITGAGVAIAASPAILAVTVTGAIGVSTIYIVMKISIRECEKADRRQLREEIMLELETKYNLKSSRPVPLKIN